MLYTTILHGCINDNFQMKNSDIFSFFFAQNIDCGYTLEPPPEPPHGGGSKEYPRSMFSGPDLEGGTRARAPPRWPTSELFLGNPCITFLPIFLCSGHKTKEKAYL